MKNLILVRHGQSQWNLEKRFTGWVDVDLTPKGKLEACKAGELIKKLDFKVEKFFTSYQKRAVNTLEIILNTIRIKPSQINKAWQLNERNYGELTGLNKEDMKEKFGEKKIYILRRSWNVAPKPLNKNNPYHPLNIKIYKDIPINKIPSTESLKDTYDRVVPYYKKNIEIFIRKNTNTVIVAHGNSLRSLCKYLFNLSNKKISDLEIPTGNPLLINFDAKLKISKCNYLDKERSKKLFFK
tara:strand:+ start:280 stop:999 length:720 start_codon:yes stop_codon:yes gene_type:complete